MIRFASASKAFGRHQAVRDVTLEIDVAHVTALLGPNGSGKTTLLKMAAGLVKPDAGSVTIGDPPRSAWEPSARSRLSVLPQRVAFPESLTGAEVVEFYRRLRSAPVESAPAALRFASLNGASRRAVSTYSGGMVQRLGLAVALLPDADFLLLDEPTAALDGPGLAAFYAHIEERRSRGRLVLFTSHQVADVERLADRVIVLVNGSVAGDFTREALDRWTAVHGRFETLYAGLIGAAPFSGPLP